MELPSVGGQIRKNKKPTPLSFYSECDKKDYPVSYLRVSTRGQAERGGGHDEGFSIPAQREANKRKALSMGAIIGKEFVDRGASAKSADRPQLQDMLKYVKENADRVDYVIVHNHGTRTGKMFHVIQSF